MAPCLCSGRDDILCNDSHCDIAGPGAPHDRNNCRVCWLKLGLDHEAGPSRPAQRPNPNEVRQRGKLATLPPAVRKEILQNLLTPLPCIHLGEPTGGKARCSTCGSQNVLADIRGCAKHVECVATPADRLERSPIRLHVCGSCPDRVAVPAAYIEVTANGIGDHLLGLTVAMAWKSANPGGVLSYVAKPHVAAWVHLFGGYDRLTTVVPKHQKPAWAAGNGGHAHFVQKCALVEGRLPPPVKPFSEGVKRWAAAFAGHVALSPWTASPNGIRDWPLERWLDLERRLGEQNIPCVVLGRTDAPAGGFAGARVLGESAEKAAALIAQAPLLIGNESGMAHLAGALGTPALVLSSLLDGPAIHSVWAASKVIQVRKLADIPADQVAALAASMLGLAPGIRSQEPGVRRTSQGHGKGGSRGRALRFCLPTGIGDCVWALTKIESIAAGQAINIILAGDPAKKIDQRCVPFLKRFDFVRNVQVRKVPLLVDPHRPTDEAGRYRYLPDGRRGDLHYLVPNKALEAGIRLEDWQPDHAINWNVMDHFDWSGTDEAVALAQAYSPFVAFYLGPLAGNTTEGQNRGGIWTPRDWADLGAALMARGLNIIVVGADYDRPYWEKHVKPLVAGMGMAWLDVIGRYEIGSSLALLRQAKALISYQCGLAMVSHYLGVPVACWWRADGDSIHPRHLVSFDERMAHCWTRPEPAYQDRYMGLIYGRQSASDILIEIDRRGWLA